MKNACYTNEIRSSFRKANLIPFKRLQDKVQSIMENARYTGNWSCD